MKRIGIDLGGTKIEAILTETDSMDILYKKRISTEQEKGYPNILEKIATLVQELKDFCHDEVTIGIGIPGSISPFTKKVRNANTQCLNEKMFRKDLEDKLQQQVFIENDANCLALSEAIHGAGQGYHSVASIILGTGMGGGIVIGGKLIKGLHENSGEWGHYSFDMEGEKCWCGRRGCMELYLSGTGFQRIYSTYAKEKKTSQEIFSLYQQGDDAACQAINDYLDYFGKGISDMIYILDPDAIVLGGGMSNLSILYDKGVEKVRENLFGDDVNFKILKSQFGDSSGVFGALLLPEMENK